MLNILADVLMIFARHRRLPTNSAELRQEMRRRDREFLRQNPKRGFDPYDL